MAYIQYVADKGKLCNSIMILAELDRLGTAADKVLLYPHSWVADEEGTWSRLLRVAEQRYGVVVKAVDPLVEGLSSPSLSPSLPPLDIISKRMYVNTDGSQQPKTPRLCLYYMLSLKPSTPESYTLILRGWC